MKLSKLVTIVFVMVISLGMLSCGGEKGKVIKYLNKVNDYVNSEEYKKSGLEFVEQSTTTSPNGEKSFDENKLNELIAGLIETKDVEFCKSVGFKDREEAGKLVNQYMTDPEVKELTEKVDKTMGTVAVELQKEGMAKMNMTMPPPEIDQMNKMKEQMNKEKSTRPDEINNKDKEQKKSE